jgi:hypothetical protein
LTATGLGAFDAQRLHRLLDLAGPKHAPDLLARLSEDLTKARDQAARAAQTSDWATLRGASHVLIALGGTVGASSLQALATQVNTAAQAQQDEALRPLLPRMLAETDALIGIVAATGADGKGAS